jgi:hypothetical protein
VFFSFGLGAAAPTTRRDEKATRNTADERSPIHH